MRKFLRRVVSDEKGVTSLEYALIGAFLFLALIGSLRLFGSSVSGLYTSVSNTMSSAMGG